MYMTARALSQREHCCWVNQASPVTQYQELSGKQAVLAKKKKKSSSSNLILLVSLEIFVFGNRVCVALDVLKLAL